MVAPIDVRRTVPRVILPIVLGTTAIVVAASRAVVGLSQRVRRAEARLAVHERRSRVHEACELAPDEETLITALGDLLAHELPTSASEVHLTDPETGGLRPVAAGVEEPGCVVGTLDGCPALHRGTTLVTDDPGRYDACPHLRARALGGRTAVCVPITAAGHPVGVVHVVGTDDRDLVEPIAIGIGGRVGVLRAIAANGRARARDALTGLLDRRGIAGRAHQLDAAETPYSLAYLDLDQFRLLNDTNGNAAGDRVLRRFAMVLTEALRPHDRVSRWDADGFVVLLPRTIVTDARIAIERVRETLARELLDLHLPRFTFSAGIAAVDRAGAAPGTTSFDAAMEQAERALLVARSVGSDRIVLANDELVAEAARAGLVPPAPDDGVPEDPDGPGGHDGHDEAPVDDGSRLPRRGELDDG